MEVFRHCRKLDWFLRTQGHGLTTTHLKSVCIHTPTLAHTHTHTNKQTVFHMNAISLQYHFATGPLSFIIFKHIANSLHSLRLLYVCKIVCSYVYAEATLRFEASTDNQHLHFDSFIHLLDFITVDSIKKTLSSSASTEFKLFAKSFANFLVSFSPPHT